MSKTIKQFFKAVKQSRFWLLFGLGCGLLFAGVCGYAAPVTITSISGNVGKAVVGLSQVLQDISVVAGIGFIMVSFFKFHQHKLNPTQVQLSQGVTLLVIGAALTVFPHLIQTPATTILGSKASISSIKTNEIGKIIGGSTT